VTRQPSKTQCGPGQTVYSSSARSGWTARLDVGPARLPSGYARRHRPFAGMVRSPPSHGPNPVPRRRMDPWRQLPLRHAWKCNRRCPDLQAPKLAGTRGVLIIGSVLHPSPPPGSPSPARPRPELAASSLSYPPFNSDVCLHDPIPDQAARSANRSRLVGTPVVGVWPSHLSSSCATLPGRLCAGRGLT
jgi:hypothetical protein